MYYLARRITITKIVPKKKRPKFFEVIFLLSFIITIKNSFFKNKIVNSPSTFQIFIAYVKPEQIVYSTIVHSTCTCTCT
jgi:hypothetical protein